MYKKQSYLNTKNQHIYLPENNGYTCMKPANQCFHFTKFNVSSGYSLFCKSHDAQTLVRPFY